MKDIWDMWIFVRKFIRLEQKYDESSPSILDPNIYKEGTLERQNTNEHNSSQIRMNNVIYRDTGFIPVPRFYVVTSLSSSSGKNDQNNIQKIIDLCLDKENGFLESIPHTTDLVLTSTPPQNIVLTPKGKMFSSMDGFLKKEIKDGLGVIWTAIISIFGALGAWNWEEIWHVLRAVI